MEELNFPIIDGHLPVPKSLSMDDYLKFVMFNWKYTIDIEACRKKKEEKITTPFLLK